MTKILKSYISEIDGLLQQFDVEHPEKSAAQRAEITKFQRVAALRDEVTKKTHQKADGLWESF